MRIEKAAPAPEALRDEIQARLAADGQAAAAEDYRHFAFTTRAPDGVLQAGLCGYIVLRSAYVSYFWVSDGLRGQGFGGQLLAAAEEHARAEGCDRIHLDTRSPRALAFYQRHGFRLFGQLPRFAGESPLFYLTKEF